MIRYLKQYKFLLFLTVLFTAISSLSYVFIAILLQQVMDIVDMGDMNYLAGKSVDFVNKSAMNGTILAHTDGNVPNLVVNIDRKSVV